MEGEGEYPRRRPAEAESDLSQQPWESVDTSVWWVTFDKLGAANRTEAVTRARELGLIP